jgi:hypothetical protein
MGTNETGTTGSPKKIDLMVERGKEGTRINRFNSSEPDRFIHGYKCSKSVQNFIIPLPLSLSSKYFSERSSQVRVFFSDGLIPAGAAVLSPNGRRHRVGK